MPNAVSILEKLKIADLDAGTVFSGSPSGKAVRGYTRPNAFTPAVDKKYIFHEQVRDIAVWFIERSDPLYVYGPPSVGKTSVIKQLAARLNYPVFEITGHNRLEFQDMTGHHTVRNGNMTFEYGPLSLAMKYGGLFLLNELDLLEPSTAAGLNGILDGQALCIAENGGELIIPHPMFRFAATANTNGGSDASGLYQGTLRMNLALMDRFIVCEIGYPKPDAEEQLLSRTASALPEPIRKKMVEYANEVRRLFMGESENSYNSNAVEVTFSTRTLLRWADLTIRYQPLAARGIQPIAYALDRALAFRACKETRAMLHEIVQRVFPVQKAKSGK
jgi:cobaltochelatase CobS